MIACLALYQRLLHDRTGRLEKSYLCFSLGKILHDRTGRLEIEQIQTLLLFYLHDRTGRLEMYPKRQLYQ